MLNLNLQVQISKLTYFVILFCVNIGILKGKPTFFFCRNKIGKKKIFIQKSFSISVIEATLRLNTHGVPSPSIFSVTSGGNAEMQPLGSDLTHMSFGLLSEFT